VQAEIRPKVVPTSAPFPAHTGPMLNSTIEAVRAVLRTDETVTARDRDNLMKLLRQGAQAPNSEPATRNEPRIVRRAEAARRLGCSLRLVDRLARDGFLTKRRLPNRQRAAGFLEADLVAVMAGRSESALTVSTKEAEAA
jgi:hypothetical protein